MKITEAAVDDLARLRARGVHTLYAAKPTTDEEYVEWQERCAAWESNLENLMESQFPLALKLDIMVLGEFADYRWPDRLQRSMSDAAFKAFQMNLNMLHQRLDRIRQLVLLLVSGRALGEM